MQPVGNLVLDDRLATTLGMWLLRAAIVVCTPAIAVAGSGDSPGAQESLGEVFTEKEPEEPGTEEIQEEADQRVGRYAYWDDGWHLTGPYTAAELLWNAKIDGDIGYIDADQAL